MKLWWRIFLAGTALLAPAQAGRGQSAAYWRVYKAEDGMHQSACITVSAAPNGKILALHRNRSFISELDGYSLKSISLPEPAGNVFAGPGNQLWATVSNGLLQEFKPGAWRLQPVPEIAAETNPVVSFYPARWGQVFFLCADRLMELRLDNPERPQTRVMLRQNQTRLGIFTDMVAARDGGLWITGEHGLGKAPKLAGDASFEGAWTDYLPPPAAFIQNLRAPREDEEGGVTVVAESSADGQTVVARFDGKDWTLQSTGAEAVERAWRSGDKILWMATQTALFRQAPGQTNLVDYQEISARQYYDGTTEPGGTCWLATSGGLFRYAPPAWRSPAAVQQINSLVRGLAEDAAGRIWFVTAGRLHSLQGEIHREFALPEPEAHDAQSVRAIFPLHNGTLLLDAGEHLVRFNPESGAFSDGLPIRDGARQARPLGLLPDGSLCVQSWNSGTAPGGSNTFYFDQYDGDQCKPLADPPPGGGYSTLLAARNGDLWLGGERGLAWYHEKKWRAFPFSDRTVPETIQNFTELTDGRIWCATQDRLWEFDGRNWSSGSSGYDHINALLSDHSGSVWVADDVGIHRFFQKVWIENSREEGLPDVTVREIFEDQGGHIWVATPHGLSRYHPEADTDAPRTVIQKPADAGTRIREGDPFTIAFNGQDKWKFTPRDRLLFSYKLDYRDWSPFTEVRTLSFSDLSDGRHVCLIRAMDRNGNIESKPMQVEVAVTVPWYHEIRLVSIACVGAATALFFAGLAFNRHRRLLRSYAEVEKKVAERTRELELASQELLQSQKMTALGTLAAGIAHDFNNILSIVQGSAQLIEENPGNLQKIRTRVDRIKTVVDQGAGIVNAMLGFSSGAGEQPGPCDLNAVTRDTLKLLGDRFLREVEVKFEPAPGLPEIHATKNFIQQILLNFIFNAAEAMTTPVLRPDKTGTTEGGRKPVVLSTQKLEQLPGGLVLAPAPAAAYFSVSVCDSGCGIPPENLPRIFEPFYTTKALSTRRGTGLGLSMVYELAKKMGAGLVVASVVDQGSTFTLILPVREQPPEARNENEHRTSNIEL
jgi:signal transduction histidine kinase